MMILVVIKEEIIDMMMVIKKMNMMTRPMKMTLKTIMVANK